MDEEPKKKRLTPKQKQFLDVFKSAAGNISVAADHMNMSRRTFHLWMNTNEKFREEAEDVKESLIDLAESKLLLNVKEGKEASVFFLLKTLGKKRGYIETVQNDFLTPPVQNIINLGSGEAPEETE